MIKAKHHTFIYPMFKWLSGWLIKRNFYKVYINGTFVDNGNAVLVIANHVSWWDGFWLMLLNLKVFNRKFHFMMLEEQLKKHWYFQYSGGFSIKKNSRSTLESLQYTIELLQNPQNFVLMFTQGEINSIYNDNIVFKKGIEKIIKSIPPETQIIFVANLIDYFSNSKPSLYINYKCLLAKDFQTTNLQKEYNTFYAEVINNQKIKKS
jgi:hypothetical protein